MIAPPLPQIWLVRSRFNEPRPALLLLPPLEAACVRSGGWGVVQGPELFAPVKLSTRLYGALSLLLRPFLSQVRRPGAVVSLGLPYLHYLLGKTFPFFALGYDLRVLWTYDVWEPELESFCDMVRRARIDLLLVSSAQAAQELRRRLQTDVQWFPEFIDSERYDASKPWKDRTIDVLSFGRAYSPYHAAIAQGCAERGINYVSNPNLPTWDALATALADAKLCVCFPRAVTNPESAGFFSTITFRYLQAMASGCLPIGNTPVDAREVFDYPAIIDVDWSDPVKQIQKTLGAADEYSPIREKNLAAVHGPLHVSGFVSRVNELVSRRLSKR